MSNFYPSLKPSAPPLEEKEGLESLQFQRLNLEAGKPHLCYLSPDLRPAHARNYSSAWICFWRSSHLASKGIELLVKKTNSQQLSLIGGRKSAVETSFADTIIRELGSYGQSKGQCRLDLDVLSEIRRQLNTSKDRQLFWKAEHRAVYIFYKLSYDYGLCKNHVGLEWQSLSSLFSSACVTGNNSPPCSALLTTLFLHRESRCFLNALQCSNGATVLPSPPFSRKCVSQPFVDPPVAICVRILHPTKRQMISSFWIDLEPKSIEDGYCLLSLLQSKQEDRKFQSELQSASLFRSVELHVPAALSGGHDLFQESVFRKWQQANYSSRSFCALIDAIPTVIPSELCNFFQVETGLEGKANIRVQDRGLTKMKWQFLDNVGIGISHFVDTDHATSKSLEDAFLAGKSSITFYRGSIHYIADFRRMTQRNVTTRKQRNLRRVPVENADEQFLPRKWQFLNAQGNWTDYPRHLSKQLTQHRDRWFNQGGWYFPSLGPFHHHFTLRYKCYQVDWLFCKQRNVNSKKQRKIRQIRNVMPEPFERWCSFQSLFRVLAGEGSHIGSKYDANSVRFVDWEWENEHGRWVKYPSKTQSKLDRVMRAGHPKCSHFCASNSQQYEIEFAAALQTNLKTRTTRKVRWRTQTQNLNCRLLHWTGPTHRATFGKTVRQLYAFIPTEQAKEIQENGGDMIRARRGWAGEGLYFHVNRQQALSRPLGLEHGTLVTARVLTGKTSHVAEPNESNFQALQMLGFDSLSRQVGHSNEYVVYHHDQVQIDSYEKW